MRHNMRFYVKATRWLRMFLNTGIQFRVHKNISLEWAKRREDRVSRLGSTFGLEPELTKRVQMVAVQAVTQYGA